MNSKYVWDKADVLSRSRMHHAPGNRAVSQSLAWRVKELITGEQWSPKQISAYLAKVGVKKTITTDNGSEFAEHEWVAHRLALDIYFTDAYASWQKGAIENTNKLIRQYITKGTDISTVTDKRIKMTQAKINRRPREKLNFSTPKQEFYKYYS